MSGNAFVPPRSALIQSRKEKLGIDILRLRGGDSVSSRKVMTQLDEASPAGAVEVAAESEPTKTFQWTVGSAALSLFLFVIGGLAEIGGGWMVWKAVREGKPKYWAVIGSVILISYGFIPTLQPVEDFGRAYAVYGGFFIFMSLIWGRVFDGMVPDLGDIIGGSLSLVGVLLMLFWPRNNK